MSEEKFTARWDNSSYQELAALETSETASLIVSRVPLLRLADAVPNDQLALLVCDLLGDPSFLERKEFLSRILRLPTNLQMACLEFINGDGPYAHQRPQLITKLRNVGTTTAQVAVMERMVPYTLSDGPASVVGGCYERDVLHRPVEPGEVIELSSDRAVFALRTFCRACLPPTRWTKGWLLPAEQDCLVEVGFMGSFSDPQTGGLVTFESRDYDDDLPFDVPQTARAADDAATVLKAQIRKAKSRKVRAK